MQLSGDHSVFFQLLYAAMNLTTNEMFNYKRYNYLKNARGKYHNPFSRGILYNLAEFFLCVQPVEPDDIRLLDLGWKDNDIRWDHKNTVS